MTYPQLTAQEKWQAFKQKGKYIYVDFDGTLCRFSYPDLGPPMPGAQRFMRELKKRGFNAVIFSSRCSAEIYTDEERAQSIEKFAKWLNHHDIPYHSIDTGNNGKPVGLAYVDDRGVAFNGNFDRCLRRIEAIREREEARFKEAEK